MKAAPKPRPTSTLPKRKPSSDPPEIEAAVMTLPRASSPEPPTTVARLGVSRRIHWASTAHTEKTNTNAPPTAWLCVGCSCPMIDGPSER
jgi:hypothetical protein